MFAGVKNFLSRHKGKFFIGAGVAGSLALLSKYAEYKLFQWHEDQTSNVIKRHKQRQYYENTRQISNATALNLSKSVIKIIERELNVDSLLKLIVDDPQNKKTYWSELKILGFSRAVATIYASALISAVINCNLMILGGYTFIQTEDDDIPVSFENQEKYLTQLQKFIENGLPTLIKKIYNACQYVSSKCSLKKSVSLEELENTFMDIVLLLNGESDQYIGDQNPFEVKPWSQYVTSVENSQPSTFKDSDIYQKMCVEMSDVLNANDFDYVVKNLVQLGVNHVMDYVAEFYPQQNFETKNCVENKSKYITKLISEVKENGEASNNEFEQINGEYVLDKTLENGEASNNKFEQINGEHVLDKTLENGEASNNKFELINGEHVLDKTKQNEKSIEHVENSIEKGEIHGKSEIEELKNSNRTETELYEMAAFNKVEVKKKTINFTVTKSVMPIAKLTPILTNLVHTCLSPAPGQLLQYLLLNEQLENFSFNVYEAFSVST